MYVYVRVARACVRFVCASFACRRVVMKIAKQEKAVESVYLTSHLSFVTLSSYTVHFHDILPRVRGGGDATSERSC